MRKLVLDRRGRWRGSRYGLMVVKTTDSAADAEQIALSGASWCLPNAQICPALRRRRKTSAATPPNRPVKPPRACAQSARSYIYIYTRQEQQMGQEVCGTAPSNTTHKHQVSDAQTRRKRRGKPRHSRGGGHSRRCRHRKPPGIDPAQQSAGLARQTPKNQQHRAPSAAPFSGMRRDFAPPQKRSS